MKNEIKWTPAVIGALARGDIENFIVAATPGGIVAPLLLAPQYLVASETLPIKCNYCTMEQVESMGIVYGEPVNDLFVSVTLPDGWRKQPTDHSMWSDLLDEQGRKRASIFYKAAFYDRDAFISLVRRYSYVTAPVLGYDDPNYRDGEWHCIVIDHDRTVLWTSETIGGEPIHSRQIDNEDERELARLAWLNWIDSKDKLGESGRAWLDENYPDWKDPLAYWE